MSYKKNDNITYDINDMIKTSNDFKEKLQGLIDLADYGPGKVGISDGKLYVSWSWFQAIQRIYYGENRQNLINFLKDVFEDYRIFNRMINACLISKIHLKEISRIRTDQNMLIRKWMQGLALLKNEYNDDEEIVEEIKKITTKYAFY